MCKWNGEWKHQRTLTINGKVECIDSCIYDIVKGLNESGLHTIASCCGHGNQPTNIMLKDGREIFIAPDWATARKVAAAFPPITSQTREKGDKVNA